MTAIREIPWAEPLLESRYDAAVDRRFRKATRRGAGAALHFLDAPWLVDTLMILSARITTRIEIDRELTDLIGLVVSQDNSCRYCFAAQRAVLRLLGFAESRIVKVEHDFMLADFDAPTKAALEYTRKISRSNPLPDPGDRKTLQATGFDHLAILEIASLAAVHTFFNRLATIAALPPAGFEALPDSWLARRLRPIMSLPVRRFYRRGSPEPLRASDREGPYAFLIDALDGLPVAHEMRQIVNGMWQSGILTRRCKAFVSGVVARALGCPHSEEESLRMLAEEGVPGDRALEVLDHLAWSEFTPQEAALVPFARETVWYQAPHLQTRAREVRGQLARAEFVEAVGVVSVANMLCRLAAALSDRPTTT